MESNALFYLSIFLVLFSAFVATISSLIMAIKSRSFLREAISYLNAANALLNKMSPPIPIEEAPAINDFNKMSPPIPIEEAPAINDFNKMSPPIPIEEAPVINDYIVDKKYISKGDSDLLFAENDDIVVISRSGFEVQCLPADKRRHNNVNVAFVDGQFLIATEETVMIEGSTDYRIVTHRYDPALCHIELVVLAATYVKAYNSRNRLTGEIERKYVFEAENVYCRREDAPFILSLSTVKINC